MEPPRLSPCNILLQQSIPSCVWFEDAIARYGVPTVVFDLHLLVPDVDQASAILRQAGWVPEQPSCYSFLSRMKYPKFERLVAPPTEGAGIENGENRRPLQLFPDSGFAKRTSTVLFSATGWAVPKDVLVDVSKTEFFPPLPIIVNSFIGSLLDAPDDSSLQNQTSLMLAYLYAHTAELKDKAFAAHLDPVHRQFHLDCLSGQMQLWTIPFVKYERHLRDAWRSGKPLSFENVPLLGQRKITCWLTTSQPP